MDEIYTTKRRWEIPNFLETEKCEEIMNLAKASPYEKLEFKMFFNVDEALAAYLWNLIKDNEELNTTYDHWRPYMVNDYVKVYFYTEANEYFPEHFDGRVYKEINKKEGLVTLTIYLNDDFEGGETVFGEDTITPEQGKALLFTQNDHVHKALPVTSGSKYILRCDIIFEKI